MTVLVALSPPGLAATGDAADPVLGTADGPPAPATTEAPVLDEPTAPEAAPPAAGLPAAFAAVPPEVAAMHMEITTCEDPLGEHLSAHPPVVVELTQVARLVAIACSGDDAEAAFRLYVHETGEIGGIHPLVFALPSKSLGWAGTELLWNVDVDGEQRLTGFLRDPGEGRCLSRGTWRWTGYAFALEKAEIATGCGTGVVPGWKQVHPPAE